MSLEVIPSMRINTTTTFTMNHLTALRKLQPLLHPSLMAASHQSLQPQPQHLHPPQQLQQCSLQHQQSGLQMLPASMALACSSHEPASAPLAALSSLVVVSFYKFADLADYADKRQPLKDLCEELRVSGGIILAPEGINGSICGTPDAVQRVLGSIQADERLANLRQTESPATEEEEEIHHGHTERSPLGAGDDAPFRWGHVRVKLKNEVVSLGVAGVSPAEKVGKYVKPKDWNSLIQQQGTMVVDVRNFYEIRIGKFKGAVNPNTTAFREFPSWVEERLLKQMECARDCALGSDSEFAKEPKEKTEGMVTALPRRIAMYCTGGIRCEKATSFLMSKGFTEVYHLEGGILKYLEEVSPAESLWEGECFVFDKRVSVDHGLKQGTYQLCYACKQPVSDNDMLSPEWEDGVSCPHCFHMKSEDEKERARARQRQYEMWGVIGGPDKGRRPASSKSEARPRRDSFGTLRNSLSQSDGDNF